MDFFVSKNKLKNHVIYRQMNEQGSKSFFFFQIKFKFFLARDGAAAPFQPDPAHSNSVRVASGNSEFGTHSIPVTPRKKNNETKDDR